MQRTLVGATREVVSKASTFGRDLPPLADGPTPPMAAEASPRSATPTQLRRFAYDFGVRAT